MENFRVKPKLGPILKSVVLGVLIFAIAQFAAVQFILADELVLMLWQEIICMLIYLGLSFIGASAIFVPLRDVLSYVEVDGNDLIIKNGHAPKERIRITKIDGYEIEDSLSLNAVVKGNGDEARRLTIFYSGKSITVDEKYYENYGRLEQFVYEKRHKNNKVRNSKSRFGEPGFYKKSKLILGIWIFDIMLGIIFLMAMWIMKSELFTKWALFLYPIIVAFRIFCSNGFLEFAETDDEQANEWLTPAMLGLFALSFFVIKAVPYFLAGRSHMRNVYVMGTTAVVFALGTFIRCVIQKKRRSLNKNFAGLFIGTICALILLELSTRGAGMVFTANEPYYEAVEVTDYIKRAGGKPRITSYYIKVRFDDGTEKSFTVSKKTYHEAKKDTVKIKTFDSILGYKVQILEGEEPQFY